MLPRLYRQAPLNSIWEGSGNIQCLDVLRALSREPQVLPVLDAELDGVAGRDGISMRRCRRCAVRWRRRRSEAQARRITEHLALLLQAAVLLRANSPIASAFVRSRLGGEHGMAFGTLPADLDTAAMLARALP